MKLLDGREQAVVATAIFIFLYVTGLFSAAATELSRPSIKLSSLFDLLPMTKSDQLIDRDIPKAIESDSGTIKNYSIQILASNQRYFQTHKFQKSAKDFPGPLVCDMVILTAHRVKNNKLKPSIETGWFADSSRSVYAKWNAATCWLNIQSHGEDASGKGSIDPIMASLVVNELYTKRNLFTNAYDAPLVMYQSLDTVITNKYVDWRELIYRLEYGFSSPPLLHSGVPQPLLRWEDVILIMLASEKKLCIDHANWERGLLEDYVTNSTFIFKPSNSAREIFKRARHLQDIDEGKPWHRALTESSKLITTEDRGDVSICTMQGQSEPEPLKFKHLSRRFTNRGVALLMPRRFLNAQGCTEHADKTLPNNLPKTVTERWFPGDFAATLEDCTIEGLTSLTHWACLASNHPEVLAWPNEETDWSEWRCQYCTNL